MKRVRLPGKALARYAPHVGFVGSSPMQVPNYLFSSEGGRSYAHCRTVVKTLQGRTAAEEFARSRRLTEFISRRGLSFSKWNGRGYEEFSVRCAPLALPLPESLFARLQEAAQQLVATLRFVLQDIYGAESPEKSPFVARLAPSDRALFLESVHASPHYFSALHHPVMKDYPFFDVVGLDLVLTRDMEAHPSLGELPFRLLEINAGSPSGAANNLHILDGLRSIDPELISNLGTVLPIDHFSILRETYDSLGRTWAGTDEGISVLVPPGGENGAAPEIHELAARSGLLYCNSNQLYVDGTGNMRVRSLDGRDPRVTSIYSRVNADSLLFDPSRDLYLRDPDTGEALSLTDSLRRVKRRESAKVNLPMESLYQVPGLLKAIHDRRIYLGGLNRVLDNKRIIDLLCLQAPRFYEDKLRALGLWRNGEVRLTPPRSLRASAANLKPLFDDPEGWVVKSPNLSGGKGVHILRCLTPRARAKVLRSVRRDPSQFAFQELVPIGRIPVPVRNEGTFRYANIAADMRMWVFFGGGSQCPVPRMTRNALVRTAPTEKGPLSSIVNTSMGGGYAGLAVVNDQSAGAEKSSCEASLVLENSPASGTVPLDAAVQLRQTARILAALRQSAFEGSRAVDRAFLAASLRAQVREVASFIGSRCLDVVQDLSRRCELSEADRAMEKRLAESRLAVVEVLSTLTDATLFARSMDVVESLCVVDFLVRYSPDDAARDRQLLQSLGAEPKLARLTRALSRLVELRDCGEWDRDPDLVEQCDALTAGFAVALRDHGTEWSVVAGADSFGPARVFVGGDVFPETEAGSARVATWWEWQNKRPIWESGIVEGEILEARAAWLRVQNEAAGLTAAQAASFIRGRRTEHFRNFPRLAQIQELMNGELDLPLKDSIHELLAVLPYARFNLKGLAESREMPLNDLFAEGEQAGRVAVLTRGDRHRLGLSQLSAGECALHRASPRALFSESDIRLWIAAENNPFVMAYTAGHEAIHAFQLEELLRRECCARREGSAAWVDFAHRRASLWESTFEEEQTARLDSFLNRISFPGFAYAMTFSKANSWVRQLLQAAEEGPAEWNSLLLTMGSVVGLGAEPGAAARVRALREVIPALENAKNIRFAKELGLRWSASAVRSALPCANALQRAWLAPSVERLMRTFEPCENDLRRLASAQVFGVFFPSSSIRTGGLGVESGFGALGYGGVGCQSQQ